MPALTAIALLVRPVTPLESFTVRLADSALTSVTDTVALPLANEALPGWLGPTPSGAVPGPLNLRLVLVYPVTVLP